MTSSGLQHYALKAVPAVCSVCHGWIPPWNSYFALPGRVQPRCLSCTPKEIVRQAIQDRAWVEAAKHPKGLTYHHISQFFLGVAPKVIAQQCALIGLPVWDTLPEQELKKLES